MQREVDAIADLDAPTRARLVESLIAYEPERRHGLRNQLIGWLLLLGGVLAAHLAGVPRWLGFVAGLLVVLALARELVKRTLRWRLAQWLRRAED